MNRQASTSLKCSSACFDRDNQRRSGIHSNPAQRLALDVHSRKDQIQTVPYCFQVPSLNSTAIPFKNVHPSRLDRGKTPAARCCQSSTRRSTNKTLYLRQAGKSAWNSLSDWLKDTSLSVVTFINIHKFFGIPEKNSRTLIG